MNLAHAEIAVLAESQDQQHAVRRPLPRLRTTGGNVVADQACASMFGYATGADIAAADLVVGGEFAA